MNPPGFVSAHSGGRKIRRATRDNPTINQGRPMLCPSRSFSVALLSGKGTVGWAERKPGLAQGELPVGRKEEGDLVLRYIEALLLIANSQD